MSRIIVEILEKSIHYTGAIIWTVEKSKTVDMGQISNVNIQKAKDKLLQLKSSLQTNQKIRILKYHNDEFGDKNRKPCKILFEE